MDLNRGRNALKQILPLKNYLLEDIIVFGELKNSNHKMVPFDLINFRPQKVVTFENYTFKEVDF